MSGKCPHCNFDVPSGERICPSCGINIFDYAPDKKKCPLCKEIYPKGTKFCLKDGTPLESGEIDFNSEATMFLSPEALKKSSKQKSSDEPISDQERILSPQPHMYDNKKSKEDKKITETIPKQDIFADSHKTEKEPEEPPKPTIDDAFQLYQALTGDKTESPKPKQPVTPDTYHSSFASASKKISEESLYSALQKEKPQEPQPTSPAMDFKIEMTPELLAAKKKLEEKYSKQHSYKKIHEQQHRIKSVKEYEDLIARSEGNADKDEPTIIPAPVKTKPGIFERIKIALRVLFPKW